MSVHSRVRRLAARTGLITWSRLRCPITHSKLRGNYVQVATTVSGNRVTRQPLYCVSSEGDIYLFEGPVRGLTVRYVFVRLVLKGKEV